MQPATLDTFVGRDHELSRLSAALLAASAGRPQLVLVEGPAGIGKTALVEHFAAAHPELAQLRASGERAERALAFGVADQLRRRAGGGGGLVDALQSESPLLVVIDDAQWVDPESLDALIFALRRVDAAPLLTVAFTATYLLTDGGPDRATLFLPIYSFDMAFELLRYGYAGAMMLLGFLGCPALGVAQYAVIRRWRLGLSH